MMLEDIFKLLEEIIFLQETERVLSSCCRLQTAPTYTEGSEDPFGDCVELFDALFEKVVEVSSNTHYDALAITGHMLAEYDLERIKFAIDNDWSVWDLDRWEATMKAIKSKPTNIILRLADFGYVYNEKGVETIASDGNLFMEVLNKPLADKGVDIEILLADLI